MEILDSKKVRVSHKGGVIKGEVQLVASKSECNRALIVNALAKGEGILSNISAARDSQTMQRLLASDTLELDVIDAGTTMRFLTAYCTATGREAIMTGTDRMCDRPIGILIDALRTLGADIDYLGKEGYPPTKIKGFTQKTKNITIDGSVSSQYISALLMIAPTLPQGLELEITGKINSIPYIKMTLSLMESYGVKHEWVSENRIKVAPQKYTSVDYSIESDWSGASYWYSILALAEEGSEIKLLGLKPNSLQGDSVLVDMMPMLGVTSEFVEGGVVLRKTKVTGKFVFNFAHCPDLAQTIAVICALKGVDAEMTGLESLKIKETDRIEALRNELAKFDVTIEVLNDNQINIATPKAVLNTPVIDTYDDHRMAMAFAPAGLVGDVIIEEPHVVVKSYPKYWEDLQAMGFAVDVIK